MQIYLTNLGKYNEGYLMGEWVKLPVSEKEFKEVLERIGIDKEHEEYFISDYEVDEDIAKISEYSSVGYLNEIAELEEILESTTLRALKALVNCGYYDDILEAYEHLHEYIFYDGMNIGDIIDDILDSENVSTYIRSYIDYERMSRDLSLSGYQNTEYGVIVSQLIKHECVIILLGD